MDLQLKVQNPDSNFNLIQCSKKTDVDPDPLSKATHILSSDKFFALNEIKYDLIFIDGLHTAEQVLKDCENALKVLNENGIIVWHDVNPSSEIMQRVPRESRQWTGDVWKAWVVMRGCKDLEMTAYDIETGLGVMKKGEQDPLLITEDLNYENLNKNRKEWLNLKEYDNC